MKILSKKKYKIIQEKMDRAYSENSELKRKLEALQYNIKKESPESNCGKTFCSACKNGYQVSSGLYTRYACLLNVPCEKFEMKR